MTDACSFYVFQFFRAASSGFQYVRFTLFLAHLALFFPFVTYAIVPYPLHYSEHTVHFPVSELSHHLF